MKGYWVPRRDKVIRLEVLQLHFFDGKLLSYEQVVSIEDIILGQYRL